MAENEKLTEQTVEETLVVESKKADDSKKKVKKAGVFSKIGKWFRDLRSEAKKVVWPTGGQVVNNTVVVIVVCVVVCAFVALLDFVFGSVRDLIAMLF